MKGLVAVIASFAAGFCAAMLIVTGNWLNLGLMGMQMGLAVGATIRNNEEQYRKGYDDCIVDVRREGAE